MTRDDADEIVRIVCRDPEHTALLMDFDGTLAEIVDHPDDAVPRPEVADLLTLLVSRFARVGIVSGRPVGFLRNRLPVEGVELVGQYGLEHWGDSEVVVDVAARPFAAAVAEVARRAEVQLQDVFVERKGEIAVTLHWRTHEEQASAVTEWAQGTAAELGLTTYPTKMAVELRPPLDVDKGRAVGRLAEGMRVVMFAGDDHGDLSGFAMLDRMVHDGALDAGIKVAVHSVEAPAQLIARADLTVDGPAAMVALLAELAERG